MQALQAADAAGDVEAAKRLAAHVRQLQAAQAAPAAPASPPVTPDTSFSSAFRHGLDMPLERFGQTAQALGFEGLGGALKGAVDAPENYSPATSNLIADPSKAWYDPRAYDYSQLPRAAVEQSGQYAGSLATRAAGAGLGGLMAGPAGAAAGGLAGPALFEGLQIVGPLVQDRAQAHGGMPTAEDWAWAVATAAASGALNAIAPNSARWTRPILEGVTEALQSVAEQAGTSVRTPEGLQVSGHEAVAEGLAGLGSSAMIDVPGMAASAVGKVPGKVAEVKARMDYSRNPAQVTSDLRVADLYERRAAASKAYDSGKSKVGADQIFKSVQDDLKAQANKLALALYTAGPNDGGVDHNGYKVLKDVISKAARHNRELAEGGADVGYFDTEIDQVRDLGLGPQYAELVENTLRDLNTVTYAGLQKNRIGPLERLAKAAVGPGNASVPGIVGGLGTALFNPPVGLGVAAASAVGPAMLNRGARAADSFLGLDQPEIVQRAAARRAALEGQGVQYGDTVAQLQQALAELGPKAKLVVPYKETDTPIDRALRERGMKRFGGWKLELQEHANDVLGNGKVSQQDIDATIRDMGAQGVLSEAQVNELLGDRVGKVSDERIYYGIQDWVINKAQGNPGTLPRPIEAVQDIMLTTPEGGRPELNPAWQENSMSAQRPDERPNIPAYPWMEQPERATYPRKPTRYEQAPRVPGMTGEVLQDINPDTFTPPTEPPWATNVPSHGTFMDTYGGGPFAGLGDAEVVQEPASDDAFPLGQNLNDPAVWRDVEKKNGKFDTMQLLRNLGIMVEPAGNPPAIKRLQEALKAQREGYSKYFGPMAGGDAVTSLPPRRSAATAEMPARSWDSSMAADAPEPRVGSAHGGVTSMGNQRPDFGPLAAPDSPQVGRIDVAQDIDFHVRGQDTQVLENPSPQEAKRLAAQAQYGQVRAMKDPDTGDVYVWDAATAIHSDIAERLGIDLGKTVDAEWTIDEIEGGLRHLYSGGGQLPRKGDLAPASARWLRGLQEQEPKVDQDLSPEARSRIANRGDSDLRGAPADLANMGDLAALRTTQKNLAAEGEPGRMWYERSGKAILDAFGGDREAARRLIEMIGVTSPDTPVSTNLQFALDAYYQKLAGQDINAGRYPASMSPKMEKAWAGEDWKGRKTNNFVTNLMREVDPTADQGVTTDIWMLRAFGFGKEGTPSPAQYDFVETEVKRLADELGWEPQQVQAAIWVAAKAGKEGKPVSDIAKGDFATFLRAQAAQVSAESIPDPRVGFIPEANQAEPAVKIEYHKAVMEALQDEVGHDAIAAALGIPSPGQVDVPGYWDGGSNPSNQALIAAPKKFKGGAEVEPAAKEALDAYAAAKGMLLRQAAVAWTRPFPAKTKGEANGISVGLGRPLTTEETLALGKRLGSINVALVGSPEGVWALNLDTAATPNKMFHGEVQRAVEDVLNGEVSLAPFASDGNYIENDWSANPNGEGYLEAIAPGRADLRETVQGIVTGLQPKVDEVSRRFAERYGWSTGQEESQPRAAAEVGPQGWLTWKGDDIGRITARSPSGMRMGYVEFRSGDQKWHAFVDGPGEVGTFDSLAEAKRVVDQQTSAAPADPNNPDDATILGMYPTTSFGATAAAKDAARANKRVPSTDMYGEAAWGFSPGGFGDAAYVSWRRRPYNEVPKGYVENLLETTPQTLDNLPQQTGVTPEGRKVAAKLITGLRDVGSGRMEDRGLSDEQVTRLAKWMVRVAVQPNKTMEGTSGFYLPQSSGGGFGDFITVNRTLPEGKYGDTLAHELGHRMDYEVLGGHQQGTLFSFGRRGPAVPASETRLPVGDPAFKAEMVEASRLARPEQWAEHDYAEAQLAPEPLLRGTSKWAEYLMQYRELLADNIRLYLRKPKEMKEVAPTVAKWLRDNLNDDERLKGIIGFAGVAGLPAVDALAMALKASDEEDDEEDEGLAPYAPPGWTRDSPWYGPAGWRGPVHEGDNFPWINGKTPPKPSKR